MTEHLIRAVAFKEGDWWVAQCLDYDLATQARGLKELIDEVQRLLASHLLLARRERVEPFAGIGRAPQRFWDLYEQGAHVAPAAPKLEIPRLEISLLAA